MAKQLDKQAWRVDTEAAWLGQYDGLQPGLSTAEQAVIAAAAHGDFLGEALAALVVKVYHARYMVKPVALSELDVMERLFDEYAFTRGQIRLIFLRGFLISDTGAYADACSVISKALVLMASRSDVLPVDAFMIYNSYYFYSAEGGVGEDWFRFAHRALAAARQLGSPSHLALMLSNLGSTHHESGNYEDALVLLTEALGLLRSARLDAMAPLVAGNLAMCQLAMENYDGAWDTVVPYLDMVEHKEGARSSDFAFFEAISAHVFAKRGMSERAEAWIARALAHALEHDDVRIQAHCHWVKGLIEQAQGDVPAAIAALRQAERLVGQLNDPFYPTEIERALSEAYAASGNFEAAYSHIRRHITLLGSSTAVASKARMQATQAQFELAETERERDFARKQQGESERARQALEALNAELKSKIDEIEALQSKLRAQAIRDPLTNLYNRRYLQEVLNKDLSQAERRNSPLCVVMLDLDYFKAVNDQYGHAMGDQVLMAMARLLGESVRGSDLACRYGGEEFCLVLGDIDLEHAVSRVRFLLKQYEDMTVEYDGKSLTGLGFSAGVAQYPEHAIAAEALLKAADDALYQAKAAGRRQVCAAPMSQ
ncbi:diguanylate cyclase [Chitinimonas sp.]|uniref:diguanylate cyclase n=1 Tax=Chitinimonas sp. TaxID=1934313 RepID=UPI0035B01E39